MNINKRLNKARLLVMSITTGLCLFLGPKPSSASVEKSVDDPPRLPMVVSFTVRDFQPQIDRTGPMNWIARNPRNLAEVFASSTTGGLWKSTDGGNNWSPLRVLRPWSVSAIAYLFDDTIGGAILVTTREDLRLNSGAGVWRSNDRGTSWTQVAQVPGGCADVPRAHGIAVRGTDVYVATSCGVLRSTDGWTFTKVPVAEFSPAGVLTGPISEHFYSVEFTPSGSVLLGGEAGFFRQMRRASGPSLGMSGKNGEMRRAFAVSPSRSRSNVVLALSGVQGTHTMMISQDDGQTWARVASSASGPGRGFGGSPFVRIFPTQAGSNDLFVFYGDSLRLYRAGPFRDGNLSRLASDRAVPWTSISPGHPDPHDIDVVAPADLPLSSRRILLATDGGLEVCDFDPPHCSESFVQGTDTGLSPIQVMNVGGQIIGSGFDAVRRLYMNTWHTDAWAFPGEEEEWIRRGGESAWLQMERHIDNTLDAQIVYNNNPLPNMLGGDRRANPVDFVDAPNVSSPPVLLQRAIFSETGASAGGTSLYVAENVTQETMPGVRWIERLRYEDCVPRPCVPLSTSDASVFAGFLDPGRTGAVLYQPFADKLAYVNLQFVSRGGRLVFRSARATYPNMTWGSRAVGVGVTLTPFTGFGEYRVLGADPSYPLHLVVPDTNNDKVMRSTDGGQTWNPIPGLTEAITRNASDPSSAIFRFSRGSQSIVSSISFFPEDPNLVILGTVENGLFFSQDRALTWQHIRNTEHITNPLSFYWRSANSVIVGSWGRGLFEITMRYRLPRSLIDTICTGCAYTPVSRFGPARFLPAVAPSDFGLQDQNFDSVVLVLNGRISGVEMNQGEVRKVWTTVGSTEYLFGSPNARFEFVTEEHTGFMGFKDLPAAEQVLIQGKVVKGLAFTGGRLTHIIYGSLETPIPSPPLLGPVSVPKNTDPHLKDPYLRIWGPGMILGATAGGKPFYVEGYLFEPNKPVELRIDSQVTAQLRTNATGKFATRLVAPSSIGPHMIVAQQMIGNRTIRAIIRLTINNSDRGGVNDTMPRGQKKRGIEKPLKIVVSRVAVGG